MATAWSPTTSHPSGGGGGFSPVEAIYGGTGVSIANNDEAPLPFTSLFSGTDLLDRTDPLNPTFLTAGTYALTAGTFATSTLTTGGWVELDLFTGGRSPVSNQSLHPDNGFAVATTQIVAAGDALIVQVYNQDGVSARTFQLDYARIVRLA